MDRLVCKAKQKFENNKSTFLFCVLVTFIVGLITHAYMYFQDSFSHDSLNEFYGYEYIEQKIRVGRFLVPIYRMLTRSNLTLPWLIGVYSLLWISMSVFLTVKLFNVKSKIFMSLISGIFTVNITVIGTTATYMHDADVDMFALFMSVLAVFIWCRYKKGYIFSAICVFIIWGLYQCYISVTITLLIIFYILELLKQKEFKPVFISGLKFISLLLIVGIIYFIIFKSVMLLGNIKEISDYNTLDNMFSMNFIRFVKNVILAYISSIYYILFPHSLLPVYLIFGLTLILIGSAGFIVFSIIFSKKIGVKEKLLILVLMAVIPLAMNVSSALSGARHDLMYFAFWLSYLFVLLIFYNIKDFKFNRGKTITFFITKFGKCVSVSVLTVILLSNVVLANKIYLKKDLEQDAALSYFTRVVDRMDSFDGYDRKNTAVVFVGMPEIFIENMNGFKNPKHLFGSDSSKYIVGTKSSYVLGSASKGYYKSYFEYKLRYSIIAEDDTPYIENDIVKDMPVFPDEGSLQMIDGTLVVKLGNIDKN